MPNALWWKPMNISEVLVLRLADSKFSACHLAAIAILTLPILVTSFSCSGSARPLLPHLLAVRSPSIFKLNTLCSPSGPLIFHGP